MCRTFRAARAHDNVLQLIPGVVADAVVCRFPAGVGSIPHLAHDARTQPGTSAAANVLVLRRLGLCGRRSEVGVGCRSQLAVPAVTRCKKIQIRVFGIPVAIDLVFIASHSPAVHCACGSAR